MLNTTDVEINRIKICKNKINYGLLWKGSENNGDKGRTPIIRT